MEREKTRSGDYCKVSATLLYVYSLDGTLRRFVWLCSMQTIDRVVVEYNVRIEKQQQQ